MWKTMYKQKLMQVSAILAVFWSSTAVVLAEAANQPAESFNDRFMALGLGVGLLAFAFFRKKSTPYPPTTKGVESNEFPTPAESASPVEPATAELAAVERVAAELAAAELVAAAKLAATKLAAVKLAAAAKLAALVTKDDSSAAQAIGKNIVVPVDFSPNSEFSMRLALVWAKPNDRVKIVYCMDLENAFPPESLTPFNLMAIHPAFEGIDVKTAKHWSQLPWVVVLPLAMEIVERWAANEFARLRRTLPMAKRGQVEFHALHGDPVNQTVKFSEAISAKLIVLAAHKHSRADRLINGSHADNLLHASRIPVIVACEPAKSEPGMPQEILLTTDFSPESLPVFLILNDLIKGAKPNITVLTVETAHEHHAKASAVLEGLETAFRSMGLQLKTVKINASNVEAGILDYVKAHKPQLIAMSSHGRMGFAELIHPSVTKAILHDAGVPILVVHGNAMPTTETVGNLSDFLRMITG